jgi:hypothetical protein
LERFLSLAICYCANNYDPSITFTIVNIHSGIAPSFGQMPHPEWAIPLRIGSIAGKLLSAPGEKPLAFLWQVGPWRYSVQMVGVGADNLLRVVAGLQLV